MYKMVEIKFVEQEETETIDNEEKKSFVSFSLSCVQCI